MCQTPPHDLGGLATGPLHVLGIPRFYREKDLAGLRPEIPLSELTARRLDRLLALIDNWIADVRAHATDPRTVNWWRQANGHHCVMSGRGELDGRRLWSREVPVLGGPVGGLCGSSAVPGAKARFR